MYANGLSTRYVADWLEQMYGKKYSRTTISNLTNVALEEVKKWKERPLEKRYSVIFIDGLSIKVRRDTVANESVYLIIGINEDGYREILDFYIGATESAALWEEVLTNLKERGVQEVLLGVMDGLPGLKDSLSVLMVKPKVNYQNQFLT